MRSRYDFYELPESERKAMIGKPFQEEITRKGHRKPQLSSTLYFPVDLHPDEFNYQQPQGLIFVTEVCAHLPDHPNWFRVGVCSPDDLDIDLDFETTDTQQAHRWREQAIEFLSDPTNLQGVFYADVLHFIQELTGAGTRTS
jgi:hypothetical protein